MMGKNFKKKLWQVEQSKQMQGNVARKEKLQL